MARSQSLKPLNLLSTKDTILPRGMSVYPPKTHWPFFMMEIVFLFLSHHVTLRWNIILSKGKEAILLIASC